MNSYKQYLRLILIFLALVLLLLVWQGYSDYQQFKNFHQQLSQRSVTSTEREIRSLMESMKQNVYLFAKHEKLLLMKLLNNPNDSVVANKIELKIKEYFPHHLAFLLADETGNIRFNHTEQFVGKTCRNELSHYAKNNFIDNPVFVHPGKQVDTEHFDVLTPLNMDENTSTGDGVGGVFFISFKLQTLRRVLAHGEIVDHHLLLLHQGESKNIELRGNSTYLQHHTSLPESFSSRVFYSLRITDSLWDLVDIPDNNLFYDEYKRLFIQGIVILSVFLLIAGFLLWMLKKEELKSGKTRGLLSALENERRRIAMDMHDQVLSELSHITRDTNQIAVSPNSKESTLKLSQLQENLGAVTNNIRAIINDLHPHILDNLGLESALRDCLQKHMNHDGSPQWVLLIDDEIESLLDNEQRFNLYRIILEIVNNIQKHADCSYFSINMTLENQTIVLLVEDNGVGFDVTKNYKGLGLSNIDTRSRLLNAQISWSKPKEGSGSIFKLTKKVTG